MIDTLAVGQTAQVKRYHPVDIILAESVDTDANPFDVEFSASFWGPEGAALTVPGFYDDELGYVVRFGAERAGTWRYRTASDVEALDGLAGALTCVANDNAAIHGPLAVNPDHPHHFVWADGEPCFLMGYEANWLMMVDQAPSDLTRINGFLDDVTAAGFNMLTVNTYTYNHPMRWTAEQQESEDIFATPALSPWHGTNDAPDYKQMNAAFFAHYDRVMVELLRRGVLCHLMIHVYNKGVEWPEPLSKDDDRYWRYIIARYQAFCNVILDPGKEMFRVAADYTIHRMGTIRALDGYRRILTVHDPNSPRPRHAWRIAKNWDPRKDLADALGDFKSDQIHLFWYEDARRNYVAAQRPYVNIEYGYERGVYEVPTNNPQRMQHWREVLRRTWLVTMGGGYINYYYCNTAWTVFIPEPTPPGYDAHRIYRDLWAATDYWTLIPDNGPVGEAEGVYCRADAGREYVVFDEAGRGFDLTIEGADGQLQAEWLNPVGGDTIEAGAFGNGTHHFDPPFGTANWAVLHLRAG